MKTLEMYRVSDSATMHDAISVIQRNESRCAVVCRPDGKVIGVFSEALGPVKRLTLKSSTGSCGALEKIVRK